MEKYRKTDKRQPNKQKTMTKILRSIKTLKEDNTTNINNVFFWKDSGRKQKPKKFLPRNTTYILKLYLH